MSQATNIKRKQRAALKRRQGYQPSKVIHTIESGIDTDQHVAVVEKVEERPTTALDKGLDTVPPSTGRAVCPVCEKSVKVRKDGTVGKHNDCVGEGQSVL